MARRKQPPVVMLARQIARGAGPKRIALMVVGLLLLWGTTAWQERVKRPVPAGVPGVPTASPSSKATPAPSSTSTRAPMPAPRTGDKLPHSRAEAPREPSVIIVNQVIRDEDGEVLYRGDTDLRPVLARIAAGVADPHENDGDVYLNLEHRLPVHRDRAYYREYVVRTPGYRGVGPQRLVIGKAGEVFYTPDHYQTFRAIDASTAN